MSTRRIDVPFEPMEMEGQRSRGNTRPWRFWAATAAGVVCLWVVLAATVLGTTAFVFSRNSQVRTSNDLLVAKANGNVVSTVPMLYRVNKINLLGLLTVSPGDWDRIEHLSFHDTNGDMHGFAVAGWSFYNASYMLLHSSVGMSIELRPSGLRVVGVDGVVREALQSEDGEVLGHLEMRRAGWYPEDIMKNDLRTALDGPLDEHGTDTAIAVQDDAGQPETCQCMSCPTGYIGVSQGRCADCGVCSVYHPSPPDKEKGGDEECFAGSSTVTVRRTDGTVNTIPMRDLAAGDHVLTAGPGRSLKFEPVLGFGFRSGTRSAATHRMTYTEVNLKSGAVLRATPWHLVSSVASPSTPQDAAAYKFIDELSVGDWVLATGINCTSSSCSLQPTQVASTRTVQAYDGWYAPLTSSGSIVVSGVLASCYAMWSHTFMHAASLPLRLYWETYGHQSMAAPSAQQDNIVGFPGLWEAKVYLATLAGPRSF